MKIALYLRVSTDKQETENQAVQLREFATKQGWQVVSEYTDYESGSKGDRAEFQRMFSDASRRKFDLVFPSRQSRWSSLFESRHALFTALRSLRSSVARPHEILAEPFRC
jgi:DNA invertase Pin-like site-specific DNA recombinase